MLEAKRPEARTHTGLSLTGKRDYSTREFSTTTAGWRIPCRTLEIGTKDS